MSRTPAKPVEINAAGPSTNHANSGRPVAPQLPVSTLQLSRGLLRLYGRLKSELRKSEGDEETLLDPEAARRYMKHIEGLMPLLGVDFDPDLLKPLRTRVQIGPLDWGDLRSGSLAILKAHGDWMTYREIAEALLARRQVELDVPTLSKFVQKVREALFFQMSVGAVERESAIGLGVHDQKQRFRLSRKMFRS